jgi:dihydroorotate dehydrogenase/NAD-dependent dihydropyrimidine dehydrogenase PreA subunit
VIEFAGVELKNPFVVASSPLTATIDVLREADRAGAAAASTKLTFIKQPFYGRLRMYNDPRVGSIVCHDRRLDMHEGVRLVEQAKKETSLVLFTNITHDPEDLEGWATLAKGLEEAGADLIEANFICPNITLTAKQLGKDEDGQGGERGGAITGQDPDAARRVTKALKEAVDIPVVCKLTPNVTDVTAIALACQEGGADGICLAGAQLSLPPVDIYNPDRVYPLLEGASMGSLGGPASRLMGYAAVAQTARRVDIPIIGGGGLQGWKHAVQYLMWGATLVTSCTEIMWHGWDIVTRIVDGLETFRREEAYDSYGDITGRALSNLRPATELEALPGAPHVDLERCNGCGVCLKPGHCFAINLVDGKAQVDPDKCYGCGICVTVCPRDALEIDGQEESVG